MIEEDRLAATSPPVAVYVEYKCQQENESQATIELESAETNIEKDVGQKRGTAEDDCDLRKKEIVADTWSEQSVETDDQQSGQFSDNFDQSSCQEDAVAPVTLADRDKQADLFELAECDEVKEPSNDKSCSSSVEEKILEDQEEPAKEEEEEEEEEARGTPTMQSRSFDDGTLSHSESCSTDAASTQEFLDTERRVLNEENCDQDVRESRETTERADARTRNLLDEDEEARLKDEEAKEEGNDNADEQNAITESSSELSVSEPTFIEKTEVVISESSVKIVSETTQCLEIENEVEPVDEEQLESHEELVSPARAPLATPDDETSDVSNAGDVSVCSYCPREIIDDDQDRDAVSRDDGRVERCCLRVLFSTSNLSDRNA